MKQIKLMADWCSDGLWNYTDYDFEISPELSREIQTWHDIYDKRKVDDPLPISIQEFDRQAIELAHKLKKELPDWEVECFLEQEGKTIIIK